MRAWGVVKLVIGLVAVGAVFFVGYIAGATSISESIDQIQVTQLAGCVPIGSVEDLGKCMGIEIQGQP